MATRLHAPERERRAERNESLFRDVNVREIEDNRQWPLADVRVRVSRGGAQRDRANALGIRSCARETDLLRGGSEG
jgi:hypothetical protein